LLHVGALLSAAQEKEVTVWAGTPNVARWLIYFMTNPQTIVDYMAVNCSTTAVGGSNLTGWLQQDDFGFFLGNVLKHRLWTSSLPLICTRICFQGAGIL
jgi:hypothetical protein